MNFTPSSTPPPIRRTRTCGKKVRTGCITCKIRHVKCDETKPECQRCISTGRLCDGYAPPPPRKSLKKRSESPKSIERPENSPLLSSSSKVLPDLPLALFNSSLQLDFFNFWTNNPAETRSIDFFYSHAANLISGFDNPHFWHRIVGQIGRTEPAIRHAITAVSAAFECAENNSETGYDVDDEFAVHAYNNAIRCLINTTYSNSPPVHVVLIVNILFACLEYLRGDIGAFLKHVHAGLRIWDDMLVSGSCNSSSRSTSTASSPLSSPSPAPQSELEMLDSDLIQEFTSIFDRLRLQVGSSKPCTQYPSSAFGEYEFRDAPLVIDSVLHAKSLFFDIIQQLMSLKMPPSFDEYLAVEQIVQHMRIEQRFRTWSTAFDNFLLYSTISLSEADLRSIKVLRVNSLSFYTSLMTFLEPEETAYDAFAAEFDQVVRISSELISEVLNTSHTMRKGSKNHMLSSVNMGIIASLHHVALHCRNPRIRRKAISLLSSTHWTEGLFSSTRSACIAQRIMQVEEGSCLGLCTDVNLPPEEGRVQRFEFLDSAADEISGRHTLVMVMGNGEVRSEVIEVRHSFGMAMGKGLKRERQQRGIKQELEEERTLMEFDEFRMIVNCQ